MVGEPATPERLAEAMVRSIVAVVVYSVVLVALVWTEAMADWFAAFGLLVPLFWLLERGHLEQWLWSSQVC